MTSLLDHTPLMHHRWLIILTIMLVAILEVLDSTIVNVALPAMMPSLSANQDQITWVLTSYVVASAIMLPLTGFLSEHFGRKQLILIDITGFMISSFICGLTNDISQMVVFRILQGAFGAALIPLSQAVLRETFPVKEQGKAMAIWGMGIMVAPVFGPTLGGYITEHSSWRWIFYINMPICLIGILLTLLVIPNSKRNPQKIDWLGIALMVIGVGALQMFLDQGNQKNWFDSNTISMLFVISIVGIAFFLWRQFTYKYPIIHFELYRDRNFAISSILLMLLAGALFGMLTLQPIMLEKLFNYPIVTAGWVMSPIGIGSAFGMVLSSQLMTRMPIKLLLVIAVSLCSAGAYIFSGYNLDTDITHFIMPNFLQGFGMGLFMVPLATYALLTIPKPSITEASGLFSYGRMLGTSIGISILSTIISQESQINWHDLTTNLSRFSPTLAKWLQLQGLTTGSPEAAARLSATLGRQAEMIAFIDGYHAIAITFLILIPFVLMLKQVDISKISMDQMGH